MFSFSGIATFVQFFFAVIIGLYFWNMLRQQQGNKVAVKKESRKELDKLHKMRDVSLSEPLSERTRPGSFEEIVGQRDGIKALKAAICGPNPQHVIVYGPPGVGKTAAARLVLEEAKQNEQSPFDKESKFVELDGTTARFDERGIADPLIGSVHDPIYQGAGAMGQAGIPQPKPGAVTKAHGGMLFIDEIGELHPIQLNKLLKVLEDRKVFLESSYYHEEDKNIPDHIHDIFTNGLPADFRMVGATTRRPQDIPPAIRSRCVEVFFRELRPPEVQSIAQGAAEKIGFPITDRALELVGKYARNGRDAVNIVQIAAGTAMTDGKKKIAGSTVRWVVNSGQYSPRPVKKVPERPLVGVVNGLAVQGPNMGTLLEIEVSAQRARERGEGDSIITGIIEEETIGDQRQGRSVRRQSMAKGSIRNVLTMLRAYMDENPDDFNLHINFPGGTPVDGPSAGVAMATAIYSAVKQQPVDNLVAMTGEISVRGLVKPVGGILPKVEAAREAGAKLALIPGENYRDYDGEIEGIEVRPVAHFEEVIEQVLESSKQAEAVPAGAS